MGTPLGLSQRHCKTWISLLEMRFDTYSKISYYELKLMFIFVPCKLDNRWYFSVFSFMADYFWTVFKSIVKEFANYIS